MCISFQNLISVKLSSSQNLIFVKWSSKREVFSYIVCAWYYFAKNFGHMWYLAMIHLNLTGAADNIHQNFPRIFRKHELSLSLKFLQKPDPQILTLFGNQRNSSVYHGQISSFAQLIAKSQCKNNVGPILLDYRYLLQQIGNFCAEQGCVTYG